MLGIWETRGGWTVSELRRSRHRAHGGLQRGKKRHLKTVARIEKLFPRLLSGLRDFLIKLDRCVQEVLWDWPV